MLHSFPSRRFCCLLSAFFRISASAEKQQELSECIVDAAGSVPVCYVYYTPFLSGLQAFIWDSHG